MDSKIKFNNKIDCIQNLLLKSEYYKAYQKLEELKEV